MSRSYVNSEAWLERALASIPLGSQTFSKSITQLPRGAAPLFVTKGEGARVEDVDGNRYLDFVNALAALTLGYRDPDVDAAVREQLEAGVSFSLAHPLETEVAEALIEVIPCAERVRFGKNGSDATAAAIRLARAHTGRDHVISCGYHGWHDWTIGTTSRHLGVPQATRALTHTFEYNDLDAARRLLEQHAGGVAALILEPMSYAWPEEGFLEGLRDLTREHDTLLVFDETLTGFRFALGGAQEVFGVVPDLATFGKGVANGHPLSIVAGRADVMRGMEEIFFSTTFGGETLSLAAARAVIAKMRREPVLKSLARHGERLQQGFDALVGRHACGSWISLGGHPALSFLGFQDAGGYSSWEIRTLFFQEIFARGLLVIGSHNLSYAHGEAEIDEALAIYDEVLALVGQAIERGELRERLRCEPLEPLFQVRATPRARKEPT